MVVKNVKSGLMRVLPETEQYKQAFHSCVE